MPAISFYQVDAFSNQAFKGNPAAICVLDSWLDDGLLQQIAAENNLSETAFIVPIATGYEIRWFTPTTEVELCGHATLAAAYVIFNCLAYPSMVVHFKTRYRGDLRVLREDDGLTLDFPSCPATSCPTPPILKQALGIEPQEVLFADDYLVVLANEDQVKQVHINKSLLMQLEGQGVIISARGEQADIVSRFFAPKYGIDEDPVTGSAHCTLTPYWCARLGKNTLVAQQLSARTGSIRCTLSPDNRVLLHGQAVLIIEGKLYYEQPLPLPNAS